MQETIENIFLAALEENKHSIYRICKVYASVPLEPEDLFQEVIYNIWKSMPTFRHDSGISTWIYRITLNVCLRSKMRLDRNSKKILSLDSISIDIAAEPSGDENKREKTRILNDCISKLPDTDKSIILLFLEDLSYKEIAFITGLTENHIAVKMKRIRKKLFDCLTLNSYENV